jgi:hypothetical protein
MLTVHVRTAATGRVYQNASPFDRLLVSIEIRIAGTRLWTRARLDGDRRIAPSSKEQLARRADLRPR